jgi:MFS family permease
MSSSATGDKGFYGWVNLATTAVMGVIGGLYLVSFGYFLPFLVEDFGWNRGVASLAATINMIVLGICGPLAGIFIMKYGAKRSLVLGNILGCLGFFLLCFHSHLWELFLGYGVLVGTGAGFGGLLASTTVINSWFVKKRSLALGIFLGSGGAGGIFMGPAMMALINKQGWRTTFVIMSGMVLLFAVILPAILIKNSPQDLGQNPDGPDGLKAQVKRKKVPPKAAYKTPVDFTAKEAMRTRSLWLLIAYFCFNMLAMGALMTHMVAHLLDIEISATLAALALSVMTAVMTLAQFASGFVGMRFSMHSIAIGGEVLKVIGVMILISTQNLPIIFVSMVVLGMGFGSVMLATMNIFPNYFGLSSYPKIMGFARFFWAFVGGAGAPLAGLIRESTGSYIPAYQAAIVVLAVGLICLIFAKAPVHPSLKAPRTDEVYAPVAQPEI